MSALGIIKKDRNRVKFRGGPFKRGVTGDLIRNPQNNENWESILIKKQK